MTPPALDMEKARMLTDAVRDEAEVLSRMLDRLADGRAYAALLYASWDDYFAEEFGDSRLLRAVQSTNGRAA